MNLKKSFSQKFFKPMVSALVVFSFISGLACRQSSARVNGNTVAIGGEQQNVAVVELPIVKQVIDAAIDQVNYTKSYDPAYVRIPYPNGDVPMETGVCSDVVVRAFRKVGIDLQKEVHLDMAKNFSTYPNKWGLRRPDTNIDHRRVPNLMTYLKRKGKAVAMTTNPQDYKPGDIVAWDLGGGITHIGLVTNLRGEAGRFKIVHNIGWGTKVEDRLFEWKIIGHYRYF
ncbi:MAG: DUF1287 domain-containing protein [Acidobacteriota bacterium]